jgi:hypothetical protein
MYMPTSFTNDVPIETGTIMTFEGMEFYYLDAPALRFLEDESVNENQYRNVDGWS